MSRSARKAVIASADLISPAGRGIEPLWETLGAGKSTLKQIERFDTAHFHSKTGGLIEGLAYHDDSRGSLVMQMFEILLGERPELKEIPAGALPILSTTKGEIDILEQAVLGENPEGAAGSRLPLLLEKLRDLLGLSRSGFVISAACISSAAALARAASLVASGEEDAVLVMAGDAVTEFVYSGFSSLMALDPEGARPFDSGRRGLSVGEAAGWALVMEKEKSEEFGMRPLGEIAGWAMASDANHMTGPSRDGSGQAAAINRALDAAEIQPDAIASISAHGTGTPYNDSMEMKAFKQIFKDPLPVWSLKGSTGHTMGAAGLIEALVALRSAAEGYAPPTVNLADVDEEARGWAAPERQAFEPGSPVLSVNSGFGGVNSALVLLPPEPGEGEEAE